MVRRQPSVSAKLPDIWLVSDARNDAVLEDVLARLPRGSGFVFRHYHLDPSARIARFERLLRIARRRNHTVILAGSRAEARKHGADGVYGTPMRRGSGVISCCTVTAHSLREIGAARRAGADAILLSPVFATRSHPGAKVLGPLRFRLLAARAGVPVIALGGMTARRARRLGTRRWAAIDGICAGLRKKPPTDS
jgi:thiamine-phosphate pyrophosphorylase